MILNRLSRYLHLPEAVQLNRDHMRIATDRAIFNVLLTRSRRNVDLNVDLFTAEFTNELGMFIHVSHPKLLCVGSPC